MNNIISGCIVPVRPNKNLTVVESPKYADNISVIIIGSDAGYRMKSYGPQCMLKTKSGETLLQHQIKTIRSVFPNSEIILVTDINNDKVIRNRPKEVRIVENQICNATNELEHVRLGINNSYYDKVIILYSNMYFNELAINAIPITTSTIIYSSSDMVSKNNVGITIVDGNATILSYGINETKWCNILYITGKELKSMKNICNNRNNSKMYIFEGINKMIDKRSIYAIEPKNMSIIQIEKLKDMEQV